MAAPGALPADALQRVVRVRTRMAVFGLGLWTAVVVGRLLLLQVFGHSSAVATVTRQSQYYTKIAARRGAILDRGGAILAESVLAPSIKYLPLPDAPLEARLKPVRALRAILDLTPADMARIQDALVKSARFVWIKRHVPEDAAERARGLGLEGIFVEREVRRVYPHGRLAAHVLGAVDIDNAGLAGIELKHDASLRGQPGEGFIRRDGGRRQYQFEVTREPKSGRDLSLTLDRVLQYTAERELERAVTENRADWGAVVVSRPATGEILAMAGCPSYDPNEFGRAPESAKIDRCIRTVFDPGSTFKIVTAAAALEQHRVGLQELFDCRAGAARLANGRPVRDHEAFHWLTFEGVLVHSSNIGAVQIGRRVSAADFYRTVRGFGFGRRTGIELPAEEPGLLAPPERWSRLTQDSMSYGYELGVTTLQILQAVNVVADRGLLVPPRLIAPGPGSAATPPVRVVSEKTAEALAAILEKVVLDGTGTGARIDGYGVAGKTGTSQIYDASSGTYSATRHLAAFAGFVPAEDPVLSVVVILEEPKRDNVYYGGQVAAPLFREVAGRALRYLGVRPTAPLPPRAVPAAGTKGGRP